MREKNVKEIVRYYYEIPEMVRLLKTEQREQESLYDTLKGTGGDGMPGGGGPGKPVEAAVIRLDERGVYERLQEIHVRLLVLEGDAAAVRGCLDGLSGKYKSILQLRHKCHHILNGKKVNVIMAAVGDGGGSYYLPTADMTALVHEVWRGAIASKEINSKSSNMVDVKFVLPGNVGGFTAREASLIDDEGDMIAVCNLPDTEKAAIEDGIAAALTILMHIVMTNSDALTFTLDPTTDTASAVCVAFTIPHEAWQSAGGAEDDEGGGTYPCRADVVCDEATAMHTPIATLDKACLAAAKACELCPTVETASGVLRFWAMKVPDGELTGSVLLVGQGGGGKSGDGSYTLPTATPFRLGGVKVGDGLTVDNEGKLSVDAANTEETTGALNEVFGAEDGK